MRFTPYLIIAPLLVFLPFSHIKAQPGMADTTIGAFFAKTINGMNLVIKPMPNAALTELTLTVKAGPVYENDSVNGISNVIRQLFVQKISAYLGKSSNSAPLQNTKFYSTINSELTVYKLTCANANIPACLKLLNDSVFTTHITNAEIDSAKVAVLAQIDSNQKDKEKVFRDTMMHRMFRQDYYKIHPYGDSTEFEFIDDISIAAYLKRYYVPNNAIVSMAGKIIPLTAQLQFETAFSKLIKSEFDPETITKIVDFHPVIYCTQFIINTEIENPEFEICWQLPGTYTNERAGYHATLLATMLNDKNNYIQVKAAKMGCKKFTAEYDARAFSAVFRIILQPDKNNLVNTYRFVVNEMSNLQNTLVNESMMNVGKLLFTREYNNLKHTNEYVEHIVSNWPFSDETYFVNLRDSIMKIRERDLRGFAYDAFNQGSYCAGLMISEADRTELKVDSAFAELNDDITRFVFTYRQNITDLEGGDNLVKRNNLLQWLTINKDMYAQINGFADEGEFNKAFDDSVMQFIDSMPTFRRTVPELIKQRYLRPEMMRVMKIIKYLYENGIAAERLSGTSMLYHSDSKTEAVANMNCTVVLSKLRQNTQRYNLAKPLKNK